MTGYQDHRFQDCLAYQEKYGMTIHLFKEPEKLGTIGGLYHLKDQLTGPFILMNGDLIFKLDFADLAGFHHRQQAQMTICTKDFSYQLPYGLIETDASHVVQKLIEKPTYPYTISAGIYLLDPAVLSILTGTYFNATDLLNHLLEQQQKVVSYSLKDKWIDMGQVHDYENALALVEKWKETNNEKDTHNGQ